MGHWRVSFAGTPLHARFSSNIHDVDLSPCYAGRWPHIHFEVFSNLASATNVSNKIATSQIALPKPTCDLVYATTGYSQCIQNLSQLSLASDHVFSDGSALELATCTGNVTSGISASLTIAV